MRARARSLYSGKLLRYTLYNLRSARGFFENFDDEGANGEAADKSPLYCGGSTRVYKDLSRALCYFVVYICTRSKRLSRLLLIELFARYNVYRVRSEIESVRIVSCIKGGIKGMEK